LYLIPLAVYMQLIPFGDIAGDRFLYTPSAGFCLLLGMAFARLRARRALAAWIAAALALAGLGWKTLRQSEHWKDSVSFNQLMIQWPDNAEAQYDYGFLLRQKGIFLGQEHIAKNKAGALSPAEGERLLGDMARYYQAALERFEKTLELEPGFDKARLAIAQIHAQSHPPRYGLARENVFRLLDERFAAVAGQAPMLYRLAAMTYGEEKNWPDALDMARKAWRHGPSDPESRRLLAEFSYRRALEAFEKEHDANLAVELLRDAGRLDPSRRDAREVLGQMLERLNRWPEALAEWKALAADYPREPMYRQRAEAIAKALARAASLKAQADASKQAGASEGEKPSPGG
jgi:tetratricopeptide (TPR) repeat protein